MSNIFILSWDQLGLEACIDVTTMEKAQVWDILKNETHSNKIGHILQGMMLRARANSQRHYEIYVMQIESGITEDDVRDMFESDPQGSADLVRERGNKIYSDRVNKQEVRIV